MWMYIYSKRLRTTWKFQAPESRRAAVCTLGSHKYFATLCETFNALKGNTI